MIMRLNRATMMWLKPLMWRPLVREDWAFIILIVEKRSHLWLEGRAHVDVENMVRARHVVDQKRADE